MYCENCGKNYANVKYTQIVNGNKREMFLCEECSKILGIDSFNIPIDFSTFLGNFFSNFEEGDILPDLLKQTELKCKRCNSTFEDFINTGKFGCPECYSAFEEKIDPLLRNIQGANRHIGRLGKINEELVKNSKKWEELEKEGQKESTISKTDNSKEILKFSRIDELKRQLRAMIKEEKYEEAAILRDKIKKLEGEN